MVVEWTIDGIWMEFDLFNGQEEIYFLYLSKA